MNARSKNVIEGIQRNYAQKVNGTTLEVFCVANSYYNKYVRKGNEEMVLASSIPALRQRCHAVTANAQLLEVKNFLLASLPGLITSIKLWSEATSRALSEEVVEQANVHDITTAREELDTKVIMIPISTDYFANL